MRPWMYTVQIVSLAILMCVFVVSLDKLVGAWYIITLVLAPFIAGSTGFTIGTLMEERKKCAEKLYEREQKRT